MSELMAKDGTYAWALLQLQAGKRLSRKAWANQGECLLRHPGLTDQMVNGGDYQAQAGVKVGTRLNYLPYIERYTSSGDVMPWLASAVDMESQDWEIFIRTPAVSDGAEYILVLDRHSRAWSSNASFEYEKWAVFPDMYVIVENNISDFPVSNFVWMDNHLSKPNYFNINFGTISPEASGSLRAMTDKKLTITVDGVEYQLGHRTSDSDYHSPQYQGSDAERIGNILKKEFQTFRFHFKWHD
ncbi:Thoeris anti-defense Tad2 family protein [Xenorhabdus bovienii]|uniref:Thoeris anti-defense Tad2 family protein n=1 Tax=Xenorhabdus bovienii TaxID=40576 RepID=UPI003DA236E5